MKSLHRVFGRAIPLSDEVEACFWYPQGWPFSASFQEEGRRLRPLTPDWGRVPPGELFHIGFAQLVP